MDKEARLDGSNAAEHPQALRLWLRLLTCTQLVENRVRAGLREHFDITLPRFDLMAQLERAPDGLRMNELSRRLMVTGGNVTGITDQLETEGLVERLPVEGDRRALRVRLTPRGQAQFGAMARQHEAWIVEAFAVLDEPELDTLHRLLGRVKAGVQAPGPGGDTVGHTGGEPAPESTPEAGPGPAANAAPNAAPDAAPNAASTDRPATRPLSLSQPTETA